VKNVTISLPDDVYRKARIKAAERDTSISAVVRDLLTEFASEESDFDRRKRLQDEVLASIRSFRAGDRMSREEVHDRAAVR
jgi:plasmid stability protein